MAEPDEPVRKSRAVFYNERREAERQENIGRIPAAKPLTLTESQRDVWKSINEIIQDNGGAVVSVPNVDPMRFECSLDNDLPEVLRYCGYAIVPSGTSVRLMPDAHQHVTPTTVAVFHLQLAPVDDMDVIP